MLSVTGTLASSIGQINPIRYRSYYYDNETGFYYLNSRYYDPEVGRFISADGYVSTGQGIFSNNMFAYCGNNPINRFDSTGHFWSSILEFVKTAVAEIGNALAARVPMYAGAGGATFVDGPLPFADTIAAIGALVITADAIANGVNQAVKAGTATKEKEKVVAVPTTKPNNGTTYYHVTTPVNAAIIMASGVMTGSSWEGGYVYAWRTRPSKYAIKNSGAHFGVIISFKTNASFSMDTGITDPRVQMYGPVVSTTSGPMVVWDVQIVGVTK